MATKMSLPELQALEDRSERSANYGERTFWNPEDRRIYKFCKKCGILSRQDALKHCHFLHCQPQKDKSDRGFVMNCELPEQNEEDFKMTLRMMGAADMPQKPRKKPTFTAAVDESVSEDASDQESKPMGKTFEKKDRFSESSFGHNSQISSNNNFHIGLTPVKDNEKSSDEEPETVKSTQEHNLPTQMGVDRLFKRCRDQAQEVKAAAMKSNQSLNQQATLAFADENYQTPGKNKFSSQMEQSDLAQQSTGADTKKASTNSNKRPRMDNPIQPKSLFQSEPRKRMCSQDTSEQPILSQQSSFARPENNITEGSMSYIKNVYSPSDQCQSLASQSGHSVRTVFTQTQGAHARAAVLAEQFEQQLLQYPKGRVMGLQRALGTEKQRRQEQEAKVKELYAELRQAYQVNREIQAFNNQMHLMAAQITDQILPQTQKIMALKQHTVDLHKKLGATQVQATYHTLLEAQEFSALEPVVTQMVQEGSVARGSGKVAAQHKSQEEKSEQDFVQPDSDKDEKPPTSRRSRR